MKTWKMEKETKHLMQLFKKCFFSLTMPLSEKTKGQMLEEKVDVSKFSTTC